MPRCARPVSITGYYHVFDRGNSKQIIFEDDSDRYRFLSDISDRFARHEVAVGLVPYGQPLPFDD